MYKFFLNRITIGLSSILLILQSCNYQNGDQNKPADHSQAKAGLIVSDKAINDIRANLDGNAILDKSVLLLKEEVDPELSLGVDVPVPKDLSGGYTHERHKKNFFLLQKAALLYKILGEDKYADYAKEMFLAYAQLYPSLPLHPSTRSYARGKLFWQCLNDANWLVYATQAYDLMYPHFSALERQKIEDDLLRPMADFLSVENPQFFNRVHNHSTWGTVAVGMTGLVLNDETLLNRALYGISDDGLDADLMDDDGGLIKSTNQAAGFLANLEEPFSPDGYYTEGPYYQRYAMYPFLVFAQALQNKKPELKIFEYKDGVIIKAVTALLNLSDAKGDFFPINDAQKGMSIYSRELVKAVDIAYNYGTRDLGLLDVAIDQGRVSLDDAGFQVALDIKAMKQEAFVKSSIELRDGPDGNGGGLAVLRSNDEEVVFKYASHGLSHGHYDRLAFSFFNNGEEIIQDYGLVRYVNIEQKGGGNYLPENTSWAKQSIAHNTVVKNRRSHFDGNYKASSSKPSSKYFYDASKPGIKISSAKESNAYDSTEMHRTLALIDDAEFGSILLDVFRVSTVGTDVEYDLPFYYSGQPMFYNFKIDVPNELKPMGKNNGYQHLFNEGESVLENGTTTFSWLDKNKFYSINTLTENGDRVVLGRIGANDPNFNLRRDPVVMFNRTKKPNTVFVSTIDAHGAYNPVTEKATGAYTNISRLELLRNTKEYTAVKMELKDKRAFILVLSNLNPLGNTTHKITIDDQFFVWTGPYLYKELKTEI